MTVACSQTAVAKDTRVLPQQVKVSDITDENSAQTYLNQAIMTTCRVLDDSRLPPDVVMRLLATAIRFDLSRSCGGPSGRPVPLRMAPGLDADIEALRSSLEGARCAERWPTDLHSSGDRRTWA